MMVVLRRMREATEDVSAYKRALKNRSVCTGENEERCHMSKCQRLNEHEHARYMSL